MSSRFKVLLFIACFSVSLPFFTACNGSRKTGCKADRTYKKQPTKKNRSNYGMKYGSKQNSPRKDYVIKNRRK